MVSVALFAAAALALYAVVLRFLGRTHAVAGFLCLLVVISSAAVLFGGLYGLVLLRPGMQVRVHDQQLWVWPSVWHDAGLAFIYLIIGVLLFLALIVLR